MTTSTTASQPMTPTTSTFKATSMEQAVSTLAQPVHHQELRALCIPMVEMPTLQLATAQT
jgi:hypothetical protein